MRGDMNNQPYARAAENRPEFILVIDRSGSMGGASIRDAAEALALCISSLPTPCLFNVIGFGSSFQAVGAVTFALAKGHGRLYSDRVHSFSRMEALSCLTRPRGRPWSTAGRCGYDFA
jgi:hypothetical protein